MIPLPLRDENRALRAPLVTWTLIALNVGAWIFQLGHGVDLSVFDYGAIPGWLVHGMRDGRIEIAHRVLLLHQEVPWPWTVLTAMFLHGGWLHLIGNMWFLYIFGDNIEDAMGRARYLIFYLACGLAAAGGQVLATPQSTAPMIGASGAIAGVLGAYLVLYPRARVKCLWVLFVFVTTIWLPAWVLLGLWFVSQFFVPIESGVAWMAHVGGFVAGALLVLLFVRRRPSGPSGDVYYAK